ncbi:transcription antitermination factor NusB [Alphaproteobacteria bacterium]|nr:transcription antitermination factor NusB [Alphaproteobacteria bacterium]
MEARRNTRKIAVQAIFQFFFSKDDINKILEEFCNYRIKEFKNYKKRYDTDFLKKVVVGVYQNEKKITKMIECNLSENWLIDRVDLTMKAIISLAIYELISYENIPLQVIVNEYVSIANQYLDKSNTGFINGILDNIAKNIRKS